jgi:SAM-dependent methyltransferase
MDDIRLLNEIAHGKYLVNHGAGEIWNWETPAGKLRWRRRVEMLSSEMQGGMEILELGCGTGYFSKEFVKTGANITAIDISPDLLSIAKKEITARNVTFAVENAYGTNFVNEQFDLIVGSSVLHHLNIDKALPELYRLLKPGGKIVFTEPNMLNPQIFIERNFRNYFPNVSPNETAFIRFILSRKLKNIGFHKIEITPFDWLHPSTPPALIRLVGSSGRIIEKIPFLREFSGSLFIKATK